MKDLHAALMRFWGRFGVPAFLSGHVPEGQKYPYITIDVTKGDAFTASVLTAFDWHQYTEAKGLGPALEERAALMDRIAKAVPPQGTRLQLPVGFCVLSRNGANFQSYYDDPEDASVIGGRTSYQINYFTN